MIKSSKELRYWILGMGLVFSCEIHFLAGSASFFFIEHLLNLDMRMNTVCPRSLDPFYIVSIYKMSKDFLDIQYNHWSAVQISLSDKDRFITLLTMDYGLFLP